MRKRRIVAITGTRADYGLLRPVMRAICRQENLALHLIVTGMHLSEEFGYTINEIKKDGLTIDALLDTLGCEDTGYGMAKYVGKCIIGISKELEAIEPDIVLILGDRGEILAGAIAASCMNILIAHIHGGETTGSVDEPFRHAITKLAHLHFAATKESADRIICMNEDPRRVFVVGAPGLDGIVNEAENPKQMAKRIGLDLRRPIILVVQHPVVTEADDAEYQARETFEAIAGLRHQTVVIYPNADPGGREMIKVIKEYEQYPFIKTFRNLPRSEFLGLMNISHAIVGNSSSAIIEAPSFRLPAVNIGSRQRGRQRANNVIDVEHNRDAIKAGIEKALHDTDFSEKLKRCENPYGDGKASKRILRILSRVQIVQELLQK